LHFIARRRCKLILDDHGAPALRVSFAALITDSQNDRLWNGEGEQSRKPLLRLRRTPLPVRTLQMTPCHSSMQADWANTSTS
jgi:hypothetical protein